jgi:hypothetical protein
MAETITLKTRGKSHFKNDFEEIVEAIRTAAPEATIEVEEPWTVAPGRYGVIFGEVLIVGLPWVGGYLAGKVADAVIAKAVEGWKKMRGDKPRARPRIVTLYGPDGEELKSVRIDESTMTDENGALRDLPEERDDG